MAKLLSGTRIYGNTTIDTYVSVGANVTANSIYESTVSTTTRLFDSANLVINSAVSSNVATLRGEITANAASANSIINSRITANVATLRGEISSNVATLNGSITTNVATLRGEITANAVSANSVIASNVATLRSEISSNISSVFGQANASYATANASYATANAAYAAANTKFSSSGGTITGTVYITQDLNVTGNITVGGNTTSISANDLVINDSIIYLANNNSSNVIDIGVVGHFIATRYQHTGVVRDHNDGTWKFFSNVVNEPTTTVNFDANTIYDKIKVGGIDTPYANVNGTDILVYSTSAYSTVNSSITNTNSYISSNVATLRGEISSNVTTLNSSISGNVTTLRGEISANAASANAVINSNISSNVATINGSIDANVATLRSEITANAASANSVINTRITANVSPVYDQANAAYAHANAAYATANSGGGGTAAVVQPVYDQANAAYATANAAYGYANTLLGSNSSAVLSSVTIANTVFSNNSTISGTYYSGTSKSIATEETTGTGLSFSSDGTKMYVSGQTNDRINQYNLSVAWDISTASNVAIANTLAQTGVSTDLFFKPDGTAFYLLDDTLDTVFQYTVATPWDITTASYATKSFSVGTQDTTPNALAFKPDGTEMYVLGQINDTIYKYTLSTPWDVTTATYASVSFSIGSQEGTGTGLVFDTTGTNFYVVGSTGDNIYQWSMSSPWNITTATFVGKTHIGFQEISSSALYIAFGQNKLFMLGTTSDTVYEYRINTGTLALNTNKLYIPGSTQIANTLYVDGATTLTGTFYSLGTSQLSTTTVSGTLTGSSTLALTGSTTSVTTLGTSATTGTTTIGGTTQTGSIIISPTTGIQSTYIQTGATLNTNTKTLYIGTGGVAGSFANILIGANNSGANGNTTLYGPNVVVSAANTAQTSFRVIGSTNATSTGTGTMTVAGGVGITGNVYSSGVYESVVSTTTRLFDSANLVMNSLISANATSDRQYTDARITANVATLRGEITANAASANSVINTNISANVATLRSEISANAASANAVINTNISANVATLRGEITANATSANSVINTNISANVATLRGEITANVNTLNSSITANAASANSVINTNISANVATLRGEITANAASANSVINSRITSNIATVNTFAQAAFDRANTGLTSAVTSLTANSNTRITQSATTGVVTFDLATVSTITPGSYTYPSMQVDAYGRTTTISSQTPVTTITANSSSRITQSATSGAVLFDLATSGVTAGTYGSATLIPTITVDTYGRVTSASNNSISTTINLVANTGTGTVSGGGTLTVNGTNSISTTVSSGTYTITNNGILSFNTRTGAVTLTSSDVTTALGYTPVNKAGDTISGNFTGITNLGANTVTHAHGARTSTIFTTASTAQVAVDSFDATVYRSAKYQVQLTSGSSYHMIELILVHNGTTVYLSQYGEVLATTSLGTFDASITGSTLSLLLTATNATTTVKLIRDAINI